MRTYLRHFVPGGTYFFTVNLAERKQNDLLIRHIETLREACRYLRRRHPFIIDAMVVLPEHLHCIWTLPDGDSDFPLRWRLLKAYFSRHIPTGERISPSRLRKNERGIWQRRLWEHMIRDDADFQRHFDYIHYNPVKHGLVTAVADWPYSSFHRYVRAGLYALHWGADLAARFESFDGGE